MTCEHTTTGDEIAACVFEAFDKLPSKRKPLHRNDGKREWVPLSGIVLAKSTSLGFTAVSAAYSSYSKAGQPLMCASLGIGMKCLPRAKIAYAGGIVLHDWHAEILAIRAFNRFLIEECASTIARNSKSLFIRLRSSGEITPSSPQPFGLATDVSIFMYCSEAPCGDASMELIMQAQHDPTPWKNDDLSEQDCDRVLRGRGHFSELGVVRRKPARRDAPQTLSKSCTDKLCLYQCTSILKAATSLIIAPEGAYIKTLVIPSSQHVPVALQRALGSTGRMSALSPPSATKWGKGFTFTPFIVETSIMEFDWSRRGSASMGKIMVASSIGAVFTPHFQETLIGGVLQGHKPGDPRGASLLCRKCMWQAVASLAASLQQPHFLNFAELKTYLDLKAHSSLVDRRLVKLEVLKLCLHGWTRNEGDEIFGLEDGT